MKDVHKRFWSLGQPEGNIFRDIRIVASKKQATIVGDLLETFTYATYKPWVVLDEEIKEWVEIQ